MLSTNDIKVLVLLENGVKTFTGLKGNSNLQSAQASRALKKLIASGAVDKKTTKNEVIYTITLAGKESLRNEIRMMYEHHTTKASQYKALIEKIGG